MGTSKADAVSPSAKPAVARLVPPATGPISVAFVLSEDATMIDFAGPWEVFQDVMLPDHEGGHEMPFQLFTVSASRTPITASGGMKIVPDYTFDSVPAPRVVVIPAQRRTPPMIEWLKTIAPGTDLMMSVCTGAFALAEAGLLKGRLATTHHLFLDRFAQEYPEVNLQRGVRFVEDGKIATAAGLTSGIDLALRVVERYFGRTVAQTTADYMEHQSKAWQT